MAGFFVVLTLLTLAKCQDKSLERLDCWSVIKEGGKMIGGMVVDEGVMMTGGTGRAAARKELHSKQKRAVGLE